MTQHQDLSIPKHCNHQPLGFYLCFYLGLIKKTVKQECLPPAFQSLHPSFSSPPTRTSDLLYFNVFEMYYEIITVDDVERLCDCRVVEAMIVVRALYSSALLNIL